MDTIQEARLVLAGAERALRKLIEHGLKEQQYAEVAKIAGFAEGVTRLLNGQGQLTTANASIIEGATQSTRLSRTAPVRQHATSKARRDEYPRFERDVDTLVKIGWSKKHKAPYEHRAQRETVINFAKHLSSVTSDGRVFAVEELIPVLDAVNGAEIPAYQVYLVLAWLRQVGVVEKKGRNGYLWRNRALNGGELDQFWNSLPAHTA
jgi:hypothetical protein